MEQTGIFENIFNTLAENAQDTSLLMIDAAYLKAHGSAAILRKKFSPMYRANKRRIELQVTRNPDAVGCLIRVLPTTGSVGDYAYLLPTLPLTLSFSGTLSRDMRLFFPGPLDKRQHTFGGVIFQGS